MKSCIPASAKGRHYRLKETVLVPQWAVVAVTNFDRDCAYTPRVKKAFAELRRFVVRAKAPV